MKTKVWKRLLPLFLSIVMLFSVFAAAIPTASALEVAAPSSGSSTGDDAPYYRIVFEDGMLRLQLNPQKVYDLLRDGSVSREDLLNFIPEDVLDTLAQGRDLSLDDLKALVSNYISPSDLIKLKEILPTEVLREHFDLAMLEDLITVEELLSLIPIDEILNGVDDAEISALITPAALELLLNETAKDAVLTDEFIENLLDEGDVLDVILADEELKEELVKLIDGAIINQLLANETIKANLLALMDSPNVLNGILEDDTALTALKNFFATKKSSVSAFLTDADVIEKIKNIQAVHDSLVNEDVINNLITANILNKNNVREIFTDAQLESLIDDTVLETLLKNATFVDNILGDDALVDALITDALLSNLLDAGAFDGKIAPADIFPGSIDWNVFGETFGITVENVAEKLSLDLNVLWNKYGTTATVETVISGEGITPAQICSAYGITVSDLIDKGYVAEGDLYNPDLMRQILLENATARRLVSDELHRHPELSLGSYWDHLDFTALVGAIGTGKIQSFVNTHDDVYENLLLKLAGTDIATALGDTLCTEILQNNASAIIRAVGMPKLFEYFNRDEIVSALGGYYAILQKGYVDEEDVITAIGGYPALMEYLPLDGVIEAVGYDRLLSFVDFNDVVASAGGYSTVFSWYTPAELQEILNAIGTDQITSFLTDSGILEQLDFRKLASDVLALLRSKGPAYKAFLQEAVDRFLLFLNTEVASISINDTEIYTPGHFDFEAIVLSILKEIPDVNTFLSMQEGDALAKWILRATIRGEEYKLGISIEFMGDFSELQELAAQHADDFVWEVSDDFHIVSKVAIPSVGAEIYKKVLLSSRVPAEFKEKLLIAPSEMSLSELAGFMTDLSEEDLQSIVDTVSEKIDVIRAKTYAKLDATLGDNAEQLAVAKAKVDQILNAFTNLDKLKTLRDKAVSFFNSKIPAELADKTLAELYEGDQSFHFKGTFSHNYYNKALALLQKLGLSKEAAVNVLVYFGDSLALEGSFDTTTTLKGIYQLTLKDSEKKTYIFYLPEGIDLSIIKEFFPSLDVEITDGAVMPSEDTTISAPDIWWQVDFYADGELVKSVYYLKGAESLDPSEIPDVPEKLGYSAVWGDYTIGEQEITRVDAIYTKITYTTTIKDKTIFPEGFEFELTYSQADRSLELPIPEKFGYTFTTWYIDVNHSGDIDEGDIELVRNSMFRLLRSAPQFDTFALPNGEMIPEGDDLALIAKFEVTYYDITFVDYDGNPIPDVTLSYTPLDFDKSALTAQFPSLSLEHYTLAWYVGDTLWDNYDLSIGGDVIVTAKKTAVPYTVIFKYADGSTETKTYSVEDYSLFENLLTPPERDGYKDGAWYLGEVKIDKFSKPTGNLEIEARYTIIEYTATFYDQAGNNVGETKFTVEGFKESYPRFPSKVGYTGEWYVISIGGAALTPSVKLDGYTLPANDMEIQAVHTTISYTVNFYREDGSLFESTSYTIENKNFTTPDVPPKTEHVGEWYVITSTGKVKLSEYEITDENLGNLQIKAFYELKTYTAYFRVDGVVIGSVTFTIESKELSDIPTIPAKRGYSAKWETYELGREDLYIDAIYTIVQYTATFTDEDGKTVGTVNFTINDKTIKAPELPEKEGTTGAWYVVKVNGEKIDPVLLSEFELTDADLTIQAMYEAEEKASFAWLWWIIIILILIIVILVVLRILKKKNLPPFKRAETPPAIIAAAIPEEEEEEEEQAEEELPETPAVPIVTVESVDVETADELMTDATAIAVVETVESEASIGPKVIVNLHVINDNFDAGDTVDLDALKSKKLVSSKAGRVKILADGTLDKPLTVVADSFSVQAIKMITLTGGHAVQKKSNI